MIQQSLRCPKCGNENNRMMDPITEKIFFCHICSKVFEVTSDAERENQENIKIAQERDTNSDT